MTEKAIKKDSKTAKSPVAKKAANFKKVHLDSKLPVYNKEGKRIESMDLDKRVFDGSVNNGVLYQAVVCYQANRRMGCASTKTRSDISGGGRKPWRQKGTGRARAGSSRSPLFRHGGVVFGPQPRDFSYTLPKKIRLRALISSLNAKLNEHSLVLIDQIELKSVKTKEVIKIISALPIVAESLKSDEKILCVFEAKDDLIRSIRNIPKVGLVRPEDITAYDILRNHKILISKGAFKKVIKRIGG